jgi:hypothetical protein
MRRRDFITASLVSLGGLVAFSGRGYGQQRQLARAAIAIGVDRPKDLPVLNAAASGAQQFSDWLSSEGFEVKLFTDKQKPVESRDIIKAASEFVNRGTLDQLVVYFSGHGFLNNYTEYWLLSGAPNDINEAVCLNENVFLARLSAIPSVIFVSDACRSTPTSLGTSLVRGSAIFPLNGLGSNVDTQIDQFLATHPGNPAFEVAVTESVPAFQGIFTAAFLNAFQDPNSNMVHTDANGVTFIPNRSLKPYLEVEVAKRAQAKSIRLKQRPDAIVESDYNTYIGRVRTVSYRIPESAPATLGDVATTELRRVGADISKSTTVMSASDLTSISNRTGFDRIKELIARTQQEPPNLKSPTGLAVTGSPLVRVFSNPRVQTTILHEGNGGNQPAWARVELGDDPGGSIALQFADGTGTVLAALRNFVASVLVDGGKVISVSYIPSENGARWSEYQSERDRLNELRTAVATSAMFGQFRIEGEVRTRSQTAEQFADRIRVLKSLDPTLGIYAAYAYAEAGLMDKVRSVRDFMRNDLKTDLFDLALLSSSIAETRLWDTALVPFCPMLAQGWNLLRAKGVRLSGEIEQARDHLQGALWTTFDSEGMTIIRNALPMAKQQ